MFVDKVNEFIDFKRRFDLLCFDALVETLFIREIRYRARFHLRKGLPFDEFTYYVMNL